MDIFRQEDDVLVARNEWAEYVIDGSGDHVELTIRLTVKKYDTIDVAKQISGAVDGWFFYERACEIALANAEDGEDE